MTGVLRFPDGREVPVRDGAILGRVAQSDIQVDDTKVSRRHARLIAQGGVVEIEDLGSSNGTFLNEREVQKRVLRDGDELRLGKVVLTYKEQAAGGAAVADDDVDLFGDDPDDEPSLAQQPAAPAAASPPPPAAPSPAKPPPAVVEFEDEIVELKQAPPKQNQPAKAPQTDEPEMVSMGGKGQPLQYSKVADRKGLVNADLTQMPSWQRWGLVVVAVAVAVGAGYLAMTAAMG